MRILVLILVFGAMGASPLFLSGASAQRSADIVIERCIERVQDEIEAMQADGPVVNLPPGIVKMGLECIPITHWRATPLYPQTDIPGVEMVPLNHVDRQMPPTGD